MGLFSKKDPCAICGGKVKGLFPTKIDGQYICSDCYGVVDLPDGTKNMTVEDFRGYMAFREENNALREKFQTAKKVDFGLFDTKFMFDTTNRLLCMDKNLGKTIFEGKHITSFLIREDESVLFEGNAQGLRRYVSQVPNLAMNLTMQINQFRMQREMYEQMERRLEQQARENGQEDNRPRQPAPRFDIPEPFQNFVVEIYFDHPYWNEFKADMSGPRFDNDRPDVNDYLRSYQNDIAVVEELAQYLTAVAFPGAPEQVIDPMNPMTAQATSFVTPAAPVAAAPATDAVEEIQRFKALLDQGIITEEEFTAKKKQLLGI